MGELCRARGLRSCQRGLGREGLGEPQVQVAPLAGQQVGIDRFSQQRMTKRVPHRRAVGSEQVVLDRLAQRVGEVILGQLRDCRQQGVIDRPSGNRGDPQHTPNDRRPRLDSSEQGVAQGIGQRFAGLKRRRQQLLREERVALGALEQPVNERRGRRFVEDCRDLLADLRARERPQLDPQRPAGSLQLEHAVTQGMARGAAHRCGS